MKVIYTFFLIFFAASFVTGVREGYKIFSSLFSGSGLFSPCTGCPNRKCVSDRAVVLGYCCGCARVSDFLPIDCPVLHPNCPVDGRKLCRDYDYMLNCCCP